MAKGMASCTTAVGRVILGTIQIEKIQALVFWVKDHHRRNLDVEQEMWTEDELIEMIQHKEAEYNFEKVEPD
jgi:hypothetical protein